MAFMKYTKVLLEKAKTMARTHDPSSPSPSNTNTKRYNDHSGDSNKHGALCSDTDTNGSDVPTASPYKSIPTITLNDDDVPLIPTYSSSTDSYIDIPDTVPLLDLHPLRANPTAWGSTLHGQAQSQTRVKIPTSQNRAFRVIIVGGGPSGLTLAHTLHNAGIDYALLERSAAIPISDDDGTGVVLWPHSARILDQLGLLRRAQDLSFPVRPRQTYLSDGTPCQHSSDNVFARSRNDHGRPCRLLSRAELLRLLWKALPEREARVRTGREVISVETHATGVRVSCADGSLEEGSIVIGCDGVDGIVRQAVCDLRTEKKRRARRFGLARFSGGRTGSNGKADKTMEARHYGLVGSAPLLDGLEPGVCYETRGDHTGKTFQVFAGEDAAYFIVYIRLDKPTRKLTSYTAQHAEYLASALAEHPVTDKIKFGDLWRVRRSGKMVDFHEGITEKWFHERVVLVGSAAHSMTPSLCLGVNTSWQGVVELTNGLRRLLLLHNNSSTGGSGLQGPNTASIKRVFKEYQDGRDDMVRRDMLISSFYLRAITHQSHQRRLDSLYSWALPTVGGDVALLERQASWAVRMGITLDFVEEKHFKEGRVKWVNPRRRGTAAASNEEERRGQTVWVYPSIPITINWAPTTNGSVRHVGKQARE